MALMSLRSKTRVTARNLSPMTWSRSKENSALAPMIQESIVGYRIILESEAFSPVLRPTAIAMLLIVPVGVA
jgi:hypothetical protein